MKGLSSNGRNTNARYRTQRIRNDLPPMEACAAKKIPRLEIKVKKFDTQWFKKKTNYDVMVSNSNTSYKTRELI